MQYKPVIGLEVHIQVKTKSKMFSSVSADYYGKAPNTCVDPVTLGLPGALPIPNKKAIEQALRLAMALQCQINPESKFDRKNYFYPDLPKGYQISQYDQPLGGKGHLDFTVKGQQRSINITRLHLEEDTGKSIHEGNETWLDFNKAGVPLVEVVTEPEFESGVDIDMFAKRLRQIVRYLGVSDGDMEKGQMRYELNISLQEHGQTELPNYKVEVKNIGSISLLQKVLQFEVERQTKLLNSGQKVVQETRGTRDMTGETYSQRIKEEAADYRYFPEPDIPPLQFSAEYLAELQASLPKLPEELLAEYLKIGISAEIAENLINTKAKVDIFNNFARINNQPAVLQEVSKLIVGELTVLKQAAGLTWSLVLPDENVLLIIIKILELKLANKINSNTSKDLIAKALKAEFGNTDAVENYLLENSLLMTANTEGLEAVVSKVLATDPTAKDRFAKNPNLAMFFVGQIMKETKGSANPGVIKELVIKLLSAT